MARPRQSENVDPFRRAFAHLKEASDYYRINKDSCDKIECKTCCFFHKKKCVLKTVSEYVSEYPTLAKHSTPC